MFLNDTTYVIRDKTEKSAIEDLFNAKPDSLKQTVRFLSVNCGAKNFTFRLGYGPDFVTFKHYFFYRMKFKY